MLICDRCEGRLNVLPTHARVDPPPAHAMAAMYAEERGDLCESCRTELTRRMREFFDPIPKPVESR